MRRHSICFSIVTLLTVGACGPTYEEGYAAGFEKGKREGFDEGKEEGLEEGREEGKEEGREEGREEGIEEGKEEGKQDVCNNILIWSTDVWTTLTGNGTC